MSVPLAEHEPSGTSRSLLSEALTLTDLCPQAWRGVYELAVSRLASVAHLEVQLAFKGLVNREERWDNNGGANWSVAIELASGEGLLPARDLPPPRDLVSSLLLRVEGELTQLGDESTALRPRCVYVASSLPVRFDCGYTLQVLSTPMPSSFLS